MFHVKHGVPPRPPRRALAPVEKAHGSSRERGVSAGRRGCEGSREAAEHGHPGDGARGVPKGRGVAAHCVFPGSRRPSWTRAVWPGAACSTWNVPELSWARGRATARRFSPARFKRGARACLPARRMVGGTEASLRWLRGPETCVRRRSGVRPQKNRAQPRSCGRPHAGRASRPGPRATPLSRGLSCSTWNGRDSDGGAAEGSRASLTPAQAPRGWCPAFGDGATNARLRISDSCWTTRARGLASGCGRCVAAQGAPETSRPSAPLRESSTWNASAGSWSMRNRSSLSCAHERTVPAHALAVALARVDTCSQARAPVARASGGSQPCDFSGSFRAPPRSAA